MSTLNQLRERISIMVAKRPSEAVLIGILLINILFFVLCSIVIYALAPGDIQEQGLPAILFYTISMVLDAGCISYVVENANQTGALLVVFCLFVVLVGMVFFTGAIIGYVTNFISSFIERADEGKRTLRISGHTLILGWNSRACEMIADLLYSESDEKVVVLSAMSKQDVEDEIEVRIDEVIKVESRASMLAALDDSEVARRAVKRSNVTYVVKEGDICSAAQLESVCIKAAKTVIILSNDTTIGSKSAESRGNAQLVKALIQVAELTGAEDSADGQRIVVEIEDRWTYKVSSNIVNQKRIVGKSNFALVKSDRILGALLGQFAICPELNLVYRDLFSNKGSYFLSRGTNYPTDRAGERAFVTNFLGKNRNAIPLTVMETRSGDREFFLVNADSAIDARTKDIAPLPELHLRPRSGLEPRKVIIVGHNQKTRSLMASLLSFEQEWGRLANHTPLDVSVIDDDAGLESHNNYQTYEFVTSTHQAGIFDDKLFESLVQELIQGTDRKVSLLVLSEESEHEDEIDASAIARLVFIQNALNKLKASDPSFDYKRVDVLVEVLQPQSIDVVSNYDISSVVVSDRYVSRIMNQIGVRGSLLDLYTQILTYDGGLVDGDGTQEIYMKPASTFFEEIPGTCTAEGLIRGVYEQSFALEGISPTIVMGYYRPGVGLRMFTGNQSKIEVTLEPDDKLVLFADH